MTEPQEAEPQWPAPDTVRLSIPRKTFLAFEVTRTYRRVRRIIDSGNLPTTLATIRSARPSDRAPVKIEDALRLGRAVGKTLTKLPADSRCLMQSVVLTAMLVRRGAESTLVIAVKPGETFGAHAWVEYLGQPLLPTFGGEFTRLTEL